MNRYVERCVKQCSERRLKRCLERSVKHRQDLLSAKPRNKGFTLLEVLVALIFFALIGLVLQQVTASTVGQYHSVRLKLFATWIAENKLTEWRIGDAFPAAREYKEDIEYAGLEWQIVSRVQSTANPFINRIDVDAYYIDEESNEKSKRVTLTGFVSKD